MRTKIELTIEQRKLLRRFFQQADEDLSKDRWSSILMQPFKGGECDVVYLPSEIANKVQKVVSDYVHSEREKIFNVGKSKRQLVHKQKKEFLPLPVIHHVHSDLDDEIPF